MIHDVVVVGAGPVGLAFAALAADQGLDVVVLERRELPRDKACGEGLMPAGVRMLSRLGVLEQIPLPERSPFCGIRFVQEDGRSVMGRFAGGEVGWGIRRSALSSALWGRAQRSGAEVRGGEAVLALERLADRVRVQTTKGTVDGRILVGADGIHSPVRRWAGLDQKVEGVRRHGARRHFAVAPWSDCVEVHLAEGAEAYVTPCGADRVGVALLWPGQLPKGAGFDGLFRARFPELAWRVGAAAAGPVLGSGPFAQAARRVVDDRVVLLGDAAGYVDALTGEGLALGFAAAEVLAVALHSALHSSRPEHALGAYERGHRRRFFRYAATARIMLALVARPRLRRRVLRFLERSEGATSRLLGFAVG